jgi:molybdenum cofactor cytidylyltransferase
MGRDKATLPIRGIPAWQRIAQTCRETGLGGVLVVGSHNEENLTAPLPAGWKKAVNPVPEKGRTGSIQTGLALLLPDTEGILLFPIDHPMAAPGTVRRLLETFLELPERTGVWLVPVCQGRGGHPILFGRRFLPHLLQADPDAPLRRILSEHGERRDLPVEDPGVLFNLDRPEDLPKSPLTGVSQDR